MTARFDPLRRRPPPETLRWATRAACPSGRLVSVRALAGGRAHAIHAVTIANPRGRQHRLVLRRWARPGWEESDREYNASREAAVLEMLAASRVPAPELVAVDAAPAECDVPTILMTRLPGRSPTERTRMTGAPMTELSEALRRIQAVDGHAAEVIPAYRPYNDLVDRTPPRAAGRPQLWARAYAVVAGQAPGGPVSFIHRDFHPGNTLWTGGRLAGVVDWTYASWGPPDVDVAHLRWNLAVDHGLEVAEAFLEVWPGEHHPYWDLRAVLDLLPECPDDPLPATDVGRLEDHVGAALARLG